MKKIFLSICALAFIGMSAMADNVDVNIAQKAGATYLASVKGQKSVNDQSMTLAYTFINSVSGAPTLYVFNHEAGGYVIVSGVNSEGPVIGYSETGTIDPANMPEAMKVFLQGMSNGIEAEQNANVIASDAKLVAWKNLSAGHIDRSLSAKADGDIQLIKYHWTQEGYFNREYPIYQGGNKCIVGCGATAAAQIMAYWRYPKCSV
ncbi:MAG: Spi family protease inhibitor, partial [Bacteroidales bacterium]|nr:Spi family protease inhibitor [Candidatus Colimorpha onthohippi]